MKKFNSLRIGFSVMAFTIASANAAQTGGHYVLPPGVSLSQFSVDLFIQCDTSSPAISSSLQGISAFFVQTEPVISGGQHNLLSGQLTERSTDSSQKLQLAAGNVVQLRADSGSSWISVGTYEDSDVQSYCRAHQAWISSPPPRSQNIPSSVLPVRLLPGVSMEVSRSAEWSICSTDFGTTHPHRVIDYAYEIKDASGNSETILVQDEVTFQNSSQCSNWVEAPWISR